MGQVIFHRPDVILSDAQFITQGTGRRIYMHPDRADVVIKLHKPFRPKPLAWLHTLLRRNRRRFGPLMHSFVEVDEIAAVVGRTGHVPTFATQFLGFIDTNLGAGAMFEAVITTDGNLAPNLEDHAQATAYDPAIVAAIDQLWDDVFQSGMVVSDPSLRNAIPVANGPHGYSLILIDGLGERTLIPIQSLSRFAHQMACNKARAKMQHGYDRLAQRA